MSSFPVVLKHLRTTAKMTQPELAQKLGVSRSAISMYELGSREPDFETLEAIADIFNVDMNTLISTEKAPTPEGGRNIELTPAFFRLKQGLEPYDISESDVDFLLEVYKAHIKKNQ